MWRFLILFLIQNMYIGAIFKQEITYFEDKRSSFSLKDIFRSEGKCWSLLLYPPEVLGGASDVCELVDVEVHTGSWLGVLRCCFEFHLKYKEGYSYQC